MKLSDLEKLAMGAIPLGNDYDSLDSSQRLILQEGVKSLMGTIDFNILSEDLKRITVVPYFMKDYERTRKILLLIVFTAYTILFNLLIGFVCCLLVSIITESLESHLLDALGMSKESRELLVKYDNLLKSLKKDQNNSDEKN